MATSTHVLPVAPCLEYLDLAGVVLADPPLPVDDRVTASGPGLGMDRDESAVARYLL